MCVQGNAIIINFSVCSGAPIKCYLNYLFFRPLSAIISWLSQNLQNRSDMNLYQSSYQCSVFTRIFQQVGISIIVYFACQIGDGQTNESMSIHVIGTTPCNLWAFYVEIRPATPAPSWLARAKQTSKTIKCCWFLMKYNFGVKNCLSCSWTTFQNITGCPCTSIPLFLGFDQ